MLGMGLALGDANSDENEDLFGNNNEGEKKS